MEILPVEKTFYLFHPFLVCRPVGLWHYAIAARGLEAAQGPQKSEGSRCSEVHSQPYLRPFFWCAGPSGRSPNFFFHGVRAQFFFQLIIRAQLFFSKNFRAQLFFSILYTPPPPLGYLMVNALIVVLFCIQIENLVTSTHAQLIIIHTYIHTYIDYVRAAIYNNMFHGLRCSL